MIFKNKKTIYIQFTNSSLLFFDEENLNNLIFTCDYHSAFIHDDKSLDVNYFSELFQNAFKNLKLKKKNILPCYILPFDWVLVKDYLENNLPDHQQERESIEFFLTQDHINIKEYHFYNDKKIKKSFAVRKKLLENIHKCFDDFQTNSSYSWLVR